MIDFNDTADVVAPQLLGCVLWGNGVGIKLTEVEAYLGAEDAAAHTHRGRTPRNQAMFGPGGHLYVYISYGIHRAGNIVCAPEGTGQGCLLRAGQVVAGLDRAVGRHPVSNVNKVASGPGNLGKVLGLDVADNGASIHGPRFQLEEPDETVEWVCGPRIGISKNVDAPLRFWIPGHPTVSRKRGRPN